jgi:hypothetical protein
MLLVSDTLDSGSLRDYSSRKETVLSDDCHTMEDWSVLCRFCWSSILNLLLSGVQGAV